MTDVKKTAKTVKDKKVCKPLLYYILNDMYHDFYKKQIQKYIFSVAIKFTTQIISIKRGSIVFHNKDIGIS